MLRGTFCFPHVIDVSALSICIVLRAFVVCEFWVESVLVFGFNIHGECDVVYL